jgi:glycine betaine/choline ABC-type transport system substrate-binding protein
MKLALCVSALMLAAVPAFADEANLGNGSASASVSTQMGSSSIGANSQASGSMDVSPTYQGGRAAYRGKSSSSLSKSETSITARLNQQSSIFSK